jgi:hypothetical protein
MQRTATAESLAVTPGGVPVLATLVDSYKKHHWGGTTKNWLKTVSEGEC